MQQTIDGTDAPMPRYQCHKKVWALKIERIAVTTLHFANPRFAPREVSEEYVKKHQPRAGGYFVVYEDGYESWSPADAFESGYTLIKE